MTQQQTLERRPKKIDLNLLPSEYRPQKKSYLSIIIYLTIFILICAMIPLVIMRSDINSDIKSLNGDFTNLQQQLSVLQANKNEADPIKAQIADTQNQLADMQADYQSFTNNRSDWSQIIAEITDLVPGKKLTLSTIGVAQNGVTIAGTSTKRIYVYDYVVALEQSDFFNNVDFSFGDCPETDKCNFTITAPLTTLNQTEGQSNE